MNIHVLLLSGILALSASCNAQDLPQNKLPEATLAGDTVTALGNNIMVVYQDKAGTHWFGSWESGLYRYDGKTILHFTTKHGLPHNRIEEIREDNAGMLYVNTSNGISRFDGSRFTTLSVIPADENAWKLDPGDLWFKSTDYSGSVYRFDGNSLYRLLLPRTAPGEAFFSARENAASPYTVYTVYKDTQGNVWFGTAALGACRYDGKSIRWISDDDVAERHNGPSNGVRSIVEDRDGRFWFNTLYRYAVSENAGGNAFYSKEKSIGSLDGQAAGSLTEYLSVAKDDDHALWFATYDAGVWRYDGNRVTQYAVKDEGRDITLFSVYKDNRGTLWLGTHNNGAYRFNGKSFERFAP